MGNDGEIVSNLIYLIFKKKTTLQPKVFPFLSQRKGEGKWQVKNSFKIKRHFKSMQFDVII